MYTEDAQGNPVYDWKIVDGIFDAYLKNGVKPYAQIGFMPKSLSTNPEPYQHSVTARRQGGIDLHRLGVSAQDYDKWRELVYQWVKHCVDKYGKAEVEQWYWEVWNEPNIGYWRGTPEEFHKLHDYAIDGVKTGAADGQGRRPRYCRGGRQWGAIFSNTACAGPTMPRGRPARPSTSSPSMPKARRPTSTACPHGHRQPASHDEYWIWDDRVVSGIEIQADRHWRIRPRRMRAVCTGPQYGYRNTTMFSSYTAACFGRSRIWPIGMA